MLVHVCEMPVAAPHSQQKCCSTAQQLVSVAVMLRLQHDAPCVWIMQCFADMLC